MPGNVLGQRTRSRRLAYRGLLLLERLTLRSADVVIAVNQSHRDLALRRGGIDAGKVVIVRSGSRRAWADIQAAAPRLKRGRKYLVLYLGEMCQQDGVDHLLHAIRRYAGWYEGDTLFAFIGGGPDQQRMKDMAAQMGLDEWVYFAGRVPDEVLWQYLATADLGVDPDPFTEWSNLSTMNKIIEYMAFGKPVVAFDLAEHRRSAQDAGVYVEPNDDAKLGIAVRELLLNEPRRQAMGQYARQRFRSDLAWRTRRAR